MYTENSSVSDVSGLSDHLSYQNNNNNNNNNDGALSTLQCVMQRPSSEGLLTECGEALDREYRKRSILLAAAVTLSLVPVICVPLVTKLDLNSEGPIGTWHLSSFIVLLFSASTMLALACAPFCLQLVSDTVSGVATACLSLLAVAVVCALPHSHAGLYAATGLAGIALGFMWVAPGVYIDNLLKHYPDVSLGLFGGMLHFFLHLGILACVVISNYSQNRDVEYFLGAGVAGVSGFAGLALQIRRPKWDAGHACVAGEFVAEHGDVGFAEVWAGLGAARCLFVAMLFHGISLQKLWVRLTQEMLDEGSFDATDPVKAALPVAAATGAVTSVFIGLLVNVSSPAVPFAVSTGCSVAASYLLYRVHDEWSYYLVGALTGVGLAGYNVLMFCILILLVQRHSASPVSMFSTWGIIVGMACGGACVYTNYASEYEEAMISACVGALSALSVVVATHSMAQMGWYRGLPRVSSIHLDDESLPQSESSGWVTRNEAAPAVTDSNGPIWTRASRMYAPHPGVSINDCSSRIAG